MSYVDPPDFVANKKVSASGAQGTTDPYALNANIVAAIKALYDLLTGDEAFTVDALLKVAATHNVKVQLGDNAGATKLSVLDSDGAEVASIDSNGNITGAFAISDHAHNGVAGDGGQLDHGTALIAASLLDDDHTQYQLESEKGAANGYAELDASALVPTDQLGTGSAGVSTYLRGDQTWATVAASAGEVLMQDGVTGPPVPIETEARDDWLYEG